jgi:hypothetical protein
VFTCAHYHSHAFVVVVFISSSLQQPNSVSNSQQSLLLSYGILTFNNNDPSCTTDPTERTTSPPSDGSTLDQRLNSDLSLLSLTQQQQQTQSISGIYPIDGVLPSSSSHMFRTLSVSTTNVGENLPGPLRTPRESIFFLDEHLSDQTTTYLLGPPAAILDDTSQTVQSRLSSFNLTSSISRAHLSHIDEEKTSFNDPYALVEPGSDPNIIPSTSANKIRQISPVVAQKSVNYADILVSSPSTMESSEINEQQQFPLSSLIIHAENPTDDTSEQHEDEQQQPQPLVQHRLSTIIYTDIDYHQTRRRDRIAQSAAKAKLDDQTPPFVL